MAARHSQLQRAAQRLWFLVPGRPVPQARPRVCRGHTFYPKESTEYRKRVADTVAEQSLGACITDPVSIAIAVRVRMRAGDLDNYIKQIVDALQDGGAIANDRQVREIHATLETGKDVAEGVTVTVDALIAAHEAGQL